MTHAPAGLGRPRLHLRETGSTSERARALALAGAPHGTVVTAGRQTAGRGRQGRAWSSPPGSLSLSLVLRGHDALLPLRTGLAVADVAGPEARVKWPNDVLVEGGKVAGVLAEAHLERGEPAAATLAALRGGDALAGRRVAWAGGAGTAAGIAEDGGLRVRLDDGGETVLAAGEVHLLDP